MKAPNLEWSANLRQNYDETQRDLARRIEGKKLSMRDEEGTERKPITSQTDTRKSGGDGAAESW